VGIAGQIGQHGFGSRQGPLGVNHPVDLFHGPQVFFEPRRILQALLFAKELQFAVVVA
jgi:hypothetical protein